MLPPYLMTLVRTEFKTLIPCKNGDGYELLTWPEKIPVELGYRNVNEPRKGEILELVV